MELFLLTGGLVLVLLLDLVRNVRVSLRILGAEPEHSGWRLIGGIGVLMRGADMCQ